MLSYCSARVGGGGVEGKEEEGTTGVCRYVPTYFLLDLDLNKIGGEGKKSGNKTEVEEERNRRG